MQFVVIMERENTKTKGGATYEEIVLHRCYYCWTFFGEDGRCAGQHQCEYWKSTKLGASWL